MNETNHETKQRELNGYRKLLLTIAAAVLGAELLESAAAALARYLLPRLSPVYAYHADFNLNPGFFRYALNGGEILVNEVYYIMIWAVNDIIVYCPLVLLFGLIFRNHAAVPDYCTKPDFNAGKLPYFFLAVYGLVGAASLLNQFLWSLVSSALGLGGLRDVFANVAPTSGGEWLIMLFFVGIVAGVAEEYIYRGALLRELRRYGDGQAVIITALLFGAFHGNFTQFLYATTVGLVLGVVAVRANSVKPAILLHMFNNCADLGRSYLYSLSGSGAIPVSEWTISVVYLGVMVLGVFTALFLALRGELTVGNAHPHLTTAERAKAAATHPAVLFSAFVLFAIMVSNI